MPDVEPKAACPRCAAALTSVADEPDWCPDCEWNLGALPTRRSRLRRRFEAYVFDVDDRLAGALIGKPPGRPGLSLDRLALLALSLVLGASVLGILVTGLALVFTAGVVWKLVGLVLVMLAVELRPRLPSMDVVLGLVRRADPPALFAALDLVSAEVGAPRVDAVVLDESFDANCRRYGLRRLVVLHLGLPLWASLSPQARVALLTHQVAHLVDGDPGSPLLAQPALATFGNLARMLDPRGVVRRHQIEPHSAYDGALTAHTPQGFLLFEWIADLISAVVFAPLSLLCTSIQFTLQAMTARGRRRAEYYADAVACDVAGTEAVLEFLETLLLAEPVSTAVRRWLRVGADVDMVQSEAQEARERNRVEQRRAEQRSIRVESDVLAEHPPVGRRLRVARSWPAVPGRLIADEFHHAAIDSQLAPAYRRVARVLASQL